MWKYLVLCLPLSMVGCHSENASSARDRNRADIERLSMAAENFHERFGYYPPSRIKLSETCNYPLRAKPGTLDAESIAFLTRIWPMLRLDPGTAIDWNGDGQISGDWTLEGDECLIFFLGGIPSSAGGTMNCLGFSTDAENPTAPGGHRIGPFFTFSPTRLQDIHGRGFFSYIDPYGLQPYAYFSACTYDRNGSTDCPTLGVWPYAEALHPKPRFWNPDTFQIVSAGADTKFGPGTPDDSRVWTPAAATSTPAEGRDDESNFYDKPLGVP